MPALATTLIPPPNIIQLPACRLKCEGSMLSKRGNAGALVACPLAYLGGGAAYALQCNRFVGHRSVVSTGCCSKLLPSRSSLLLREEEAG